MEALCKWMLGLSSFSGQGVPRRKDDIVVASPPGDVTKGET